MSYRYRRQQIEHYHEMAERALAEHAIKEHFDHGSVQGWYVRNPKWSGYWFEVWTGPCWLMIRGDLGAMVWEREPDMLGWLRNAIDDVDYLAEKATSGDSRDSHGTRDDWNPEAAIDSLLECAWELKASAWERGSGDGVGTFDREPEAEEYDEAKALLELARTVKVGEGENGPIGDAGGLYAEAGEQELDGHFHDGGISTWAWNSQYLWRRECLIKLLDLIDSKTE